MVTQSLPISIVCAVITGLLFTLSVASTGYVAHLDRESKRQQKNLIVNGTINDEEGETSINSEQFSDDSPEEVKEEKIIKPVTRRTWVLANCGNIFFRLAGSALTFVGVIYGPISIFQPILATSQIFTAIMIFSYVLKIEVGFKLLISSWFHCEYFHCHSLHFMFLTFLLPFTIGRILRQKKLESEYVSFYATF